MTQQLKNNPKGISQEPVPTSLDLRYEDHLYFDKAVPSTGKKRRTSLKDDGMQGFSPVRECDFIPDYTKLMGLENGYALAAVSHLLKDLSPSQLRIFSATINTLPRLEQHNLHFGQKVYINISSPTLEYIECFVSAFVVGASSPNEDAMIYLSGDSSNLQNINIFEHSSSPEEIEKIKKKAKKKVKKKLKGLKKNPHVSMQVNVSSIYSQEQFEEIYEKCVKEGKVSVPKKQRQCLPWERKLIIPPLRSKEEEREIDSIMTLDSVDPKWLDSRKPCVVKDPLKRELKPRKKGKVGDTVKSIKTKGKA